MDVPMQMLADSLYVLALLNPVSKISVLSALTSEESADELRSAAAKSTAVAATLLIVTIAFGEFILRVVFHLELHSLRIAGGVVLFWVGFNALRRGVFFERDVPSRFADIAVVPLACPMIAGPAAITASLALAAQRGILAATGSVLIALSVNLVVMMQARSIGAALARFNVLGALIRITGLVVMTMGVQMTLDGASQWVERSFG
jgi:multiple antibiotic resistance protein